MTAKAIDFSYDLLIEYPGCSPFSADNEWLLLLHPEGRVGLHRAADGIFKRLLPLPISHHSENRWWPGNPRSLFFMHGGSLWLYDVGLDIISRIHRFTEYIQFTSDDKDGVHGMGESDISRDGRHFALRGIRPDGGIEVFVYVLPDVKGPVTIIEPFDGLKITASNQIILSRAEGPSKGMWLVDKVTDDVSSFRLLASHDGHAAVSTYQGRDVLLWCSSAFGKVNAVKMIDVATGQEIRTLMQFPWDYGLHIAACDLEMCMISAVDPKGNLLSQIWKVPFGENTKGELLHEFRTVWRSGQQSEPRAALSRDGTKCVFNVDDGTKTTPWLLDITVSGTAQPAPSLPPAAEPRPDRIDYSVYVGDVVFVMVPRKHGGIDIVPMKVPATIGPEIFEREL
jgi:hypothetical protein